MPADIGGSSGGSVSCESASSARSEASVGQWLGLEGVGLGNGCAIDEGLLAFGAPHDVGLEPDHGVASARRAAFHRFQQEAHGAPGGELQVGGDRRLQVGDQAHPYNLRGAGRVAFGKIGKRRHRVKRAGS